MDNDGFGIAFTGGFMSATLFGLILMAIVAPSSEKSLREQTINYCVETPQKCKLEYDYLKMKGALTK